MSKEEDAKELERIICESVDSILYDYEIMLWNRDRFDIASVPWVSEAFSKKKYALNVCTSYSLSDTT